MEAESAEIALQTFREARPMLNMSDALASALSVWTFSPITGIVRAPSQILLIPESHPAMRRR